MRCPRCQFDHPSQTTECLKCGVVFARYQPQEPLTAAAETANVSVSPVPAVVPSLSAGNQAFATTLVQHMASSLESSLELPDQPATRSDAFKELKLRALALPLALIIARLLMGTGFRVVASLLAMPLHESGHAITAWLTGRWAIPMLWVTMHGEERSWLIVLAVTAAIAFLGFWAWRTEHWAWLCAAGAMLIVQIAFLNLPAGPAIVFGGDGGALVLATLLMATFYSPRESKLYKGSGVRWGLLAIGAAAFMYVFGVWSGPFEDIPFGELEGVNLSDPSLLTEMYGWSVIQLVDRYLRLATFCFAVLAVLYVWGLVSAYLDMRHVARTTPASA